MPLVTIPNCNLGEFPRPHLDTIREIRAQYQTLPPMAPGKPTPKISIAVGDMHGNWWKLFCILVYLGLIDITKNEIKTLFSNIGARIQDLSMCHIHLFLSSLRPGPLVGQVKLILIGDVFADRGPSDYMTVRLLQRMIQLGIDFIIIMSNHDYLFISLMEQHGAIRRLDVTHSAWELMDDTSLLAQVQKIYYEDIYHEGKILYPALWKKYRMVYCCKDICNDQYKTVFYTHAPNNLTSFYLLAADCVLGSLAQDLERQQPRPSENLQLLYGGLPFEKTVLAVNSRFQKLLKDKRFCEHIDDKPNIQQFLGMLDHVDPMTVPAETGVITVCGHIGTEIYRRMSSVRPIAFSLEQFCLDSIFGVHLRDNSGITDHNKIGDLHVYIAIDDPSYQNTLLAPLLGPEVQEYSFRLQIMAEENAEYYGIMSDFNRKPQQPPV